MAAQRSTWKAEPTTKRASPDSTHVDLAPPTTRSDQHLEGLFLRARGCQQSAERQQCGRASWHLQKILAPSLAISGVCVVGRAALSTVACLQLKAGLWIILESRLFPEKSEVRFCRPPLASPFLNRKRLYLSLHEYRDRGRYNLLNQISEICLQVHSPNDSREIVTCAPCVTREVTEYLKQMV